MNESICEAIRNLNLLRLRYHWGYRIVEPHAYGLNRKGDQLLRAYQTSGDSESGEPEGWKLFRLAEADEITVLREHFFGPRAGYKPGDKALNAITYCEL